MNPYGSARIILPLVARGWTPHRVLDVGCGRGEWLFAAKELWGAETVGIDHHDPSYIDPAIMDEYRKMNLTAKTLKSQGTFDLAICLEVAEHLCHECAERLVVFLCKSANVVLFSAAPPGQGPYPPADFPLDKWSAWHINEQTSQYWGLEFRRQGFEQRDAIRPHVRPPVPVDPWYSSNTFLYVRP